MINKLKIGDFAKYNNISIQTLRYYESIDLLLPSFVDSITNYRYYSISQSAALDNIRVLKQFGYSLKDIKNILTDHDDYTELNKIIEEKKGQLIKNKNDINQKIIDITAFQEGAMIYKDKIDQHNIEFIEFSERYLLTYHIKKNIYDMSKDEYEIYLRNFREHINSQSIPLSLFSKVGSIIQKNDFLNNYMNSENLFILTRNENISNYLLKAGMYAVFYCDSFSNELAMIKKFKREIEKNNYKIEGDYICEVVYERSFSKSIERTMFIRMQVLVKKI